MRKRGKVKIVLVIPSDFSENLSLQKKANLQMIVDGTDINLGNQISNYLQNIIVDFYKNKAKNSIQSYNVTPEIRMLYNPQLKGAPNFVPGVMALILLIVCVMMTAIAIVKEKETGTMEILLVSPMKPSFVIIAKAVPYFILSMLIVLVILILSYFLLDLPIKGSLILLLFVSTIFILTNLLIGILISIFVKTQQQAMFTVFFFLMIFNLMSGLFTPVESMPIWAQKMTNLNPLRQLIEVIRLIILKNAGFMNLLPQFFSILAMAIVFNSWAIWNYRKTS